ncbi:MAG: lytic transglycosylase domain-containing protein [Alphaproteobacteria bacterium]|nr:lytic transglycosylase domain-containing protein [Alphaproteobacteria bacterium]
MNWCSGACARTICAAGLGLAALVGVACFGVALADDLGTGPGSEARAEILTAALSSDASPVSRVVSLPRLLSAEDALRYRRIFRLQEVGDWPAADTIIAELGDDILYGHVLFQRYMHPTAYRSKFQELAAWLEDYADLPGAFRIWRLAMKRRPEQAPVPRRPDRAYLSGYGSENVAAGSKLPSRKLRAWQREAIAELTKKIRRLIRGGGPTAASKILARPELQDWLTEAEIDFWRAEIGRSYYAHGKDEKALAFAGGAADRSGRVLPGSRWTTGLAAWRLGDLKIARKHFEALAEADIDDEYLVAGGAFWAARVHGLAGQPALAERMLGIAAEFPHTIYGFLARHRLGIAPGFDWDRAGLTEAEANLLTRATAARRALALGEIGEARLAEQEIRKHYPHAGPNMARALLKLAEHLDLPSLQMRIGAKMHQADGRRHDRALYPIPGWAPQPAMGIDRALVLALVRQESGFDANARSRRGARGLMQLMPRTASFVDGAARYHRGKAHRLYEPELNLALGRKYIRHLLESTRIEGNLLFLLAAYNSGPAKLGKWRNQVDFRDDPLLFMESVPSLETRRFMRRVLANLWIYRHRLGQEAVSLKSLAAVRWPVYVGLDSTQTVADLAGE